MRRGPHKSSQGEREFVFEEILDFCSQGYWAVLPYESVRDWPNLRLSPLGVVPQRDRRPRLIVDYSYSALNDDTLALAPKEAMQFGRALQRVIQTIVESDPRYGPVYLSKIDIADGFYRVWLNFYDIPKLGVVLPTSTGAPHLVAFPLALPMGWVESPPYFCAFTETACDLSNYRLRRHSTDERPRSTMHRLEAIAATPPSDVVEESTTWQPASCRHRPQIGRPPVARVDVYVDDFLLMAQTEPQKRNVLRTTLQAIDDVFRPLEPADPHHRKEPASIKKMLKGDACWSTRKRILGWDFDTRASTMQLPQHRLERLYDLLHQLDPPRKRASVTFWHKLLGELRSMSPALPGSKGLFSVLQHSLHTSTGNRVRITQRVRDMAADFRDIADALQDRPTRLPELHPREPHYIGACDASGVGMGGVWFGPSTEAAGAFPPTVWRMAFPKPVQRALVTADNPKGTISISDLELAALIGHKDVLAHHTNVAERTLWVATDNMAAMSWSSKGSSTSLGPRAYLLRLNSLHQRCHRYVPTTSHIAGITVAPLDGTTRHQLSADWSAVLQATQQRVSARRVTSASSSWQLWVAFCHGLGVDPGSLPSDPVPLLQVFAQRLRAGSIAPGRHPVRSRTVEDAIRAVGQTYAGMGAPDPRLSNHGQLDFRLRALYRSWATADDPPSRVKPLPMGLLTNTVHLASVEATPAALAAADCLIVGFYFLLRPGEYLGVPTPADNLFRLKDLQLWIGSRALDLATCPVADLRAATFATLTFTRQKNGVRNERIGHGRSGHPTLCPVLALAARACALRSLSCPSTTPLNAFASAPGAPLQFVLPHDLTHRLRSALAIYPDPAFTPADVSARSTRAGGAMALLCAGVPSDRIKMVGRWRSDELYRYLHVQAQPVMTGLSASMLRGGSYRLGPG